MAKKEESKIVLERTYNVPLRKYFASERYYKRTKRAVSGLMEFLQQHMKSKDIKIGKYLNLEIWKHGIKNPPHHVNIKVTKDDKGVVMAELVTVPVQRIDKKKAKKAAKTAKAASAKANEVKKQAEQAKEPVTDAAAQSDAGEEKPKKKAVKAEEKDQE